MLLPFFATFRAEDSEEPYNKALFTILFPVPQSSFNIAADEPAYAESQLPLALANGTPISIRQPPS